MIQSDEELSEAYEIDEAPVVRLGASEDAQVEKLDDSPAVA